MTGHIFDADWGWVNDLEHVFRYGNKVSPRGMLVYECLAYQSRISMFNPIIMNPERELGYKFMAAEAAWILNGQDDVKSIAPYSRAISKFSDDGQIFAGAYGPPIAIQYNYVRNNLVKDPDSRQAVLTIWRQNPGPSKDIPCTVALQWVIRAGVLHCIATMRSSDLWLGHVYDIFNFSAISFALMIDLNVKRREEGLPDLDLGELILTAGSKHIYEKDVDKVGNILDGPRHQSAGRKRAFRSEMYESSDEFIQHLWQCADTHEGALYLIK